MVQDPKGGKYVGTVTGTERNTKARLGFEGGHKPLIFTSQSPSMDLKYMSNMLNNESYQNVCIMDSNINELALQ